MWRESIGEAGLTPALSFNGINSTSPITSVADSDEEREGGREREVGAGIEVISLLFECAITLAATVTERHDLTRGERVF